MPDDDYSEGKIVEFVSEARRRAKDALSRVAEAALVAADDENVTDAELDEVKDAQRFNRRYGFRWPLLDRQRLLLFQKDRGLADSEIRLLKQSGNLHRRPDGLVLTARRWLAWLGWAHIVILAVVFGPLMGLGLLAYWARLDPLQWLRLSLVALSVSCLAAAIYFQFVKPWRIQWRVDGLRDATFRSEGESV